MKNKNFPFYVVKVNNQYVSISAKLRLKLVDDIEKCSYWRSRRAINTWKDTFKVKYPNYEIVGAKLAEA